MIKRAGPTAQLLVRRWSARLSRDILASWLDLLNSQGWIAREQVPTCSDPLHAQKGAPMNLVLLQKHGSFASWPVPAQQPG